MRRLLLCGAVAVQTMGAGGAGGIDAAAAASPSWFKTDLHHHSTFSGDAFGDMGVVAQAAKAQDFHAIFLTDHNNGSSFEVSDLTANRMVLDDSLRRWSQAGSTDLDAGTNEMVQAPDPVLSGTASLHLRAEDATAGETFVWTRRGPLVRSGDTIIRLWIRAERIDPGSGVYVSASIGGDPTVEVPLSYTTADGTVGTGKSTTLVWQLGTPRTPSADPDRRVVVSSLGAPDIGRWREYTINVSDGLAQIPAKDRPAGHVGITYLKIAASGKSGTAAAYVDKVSIDASGPVPPAEEFAYRNEIVSSWNTPSFRLFPSVELGTRTHTQRFNFGSVDPADFVYHEHGVDGIAETKATGYPAMLNHPGDDGGDSIADVVATGARGADLLEVRQDTWRTAWDAVLDGGVHILGGGSTDSHRTVTPSSLATYIRSESLAFDALMRHLYEGRTYMALSKFSGRIAFNLDRASAEPFPARHPALVGAGRERIGVHLKIDGGIPNGSVVRWVRNGRILASDAPGGRTYETTRSIDLSGASTVVRAELLDSAGNLLALTQPLRFTDVARLPAEHMVTVDAVETANGRGYTNIFTKGITGASYETDAKAVTMTLDNPREATIDATVGSTVAPSAVTLDGAAVPRLDSLVALRRSASGWYFDVLAEELYVRVRQPLARAQLRASFAATQDATPPTVPGLPRGWATGAHAAHLRWNPSTDDEGVAGYRILRDGEVIGRVPHPATTFDDTGLDPAATYRYTVEAVDAVGNESPRPPAIAVRTRFSHTETFVPEADTYVSAASRDTKFGSATALRALDEPDVWTLLRFNPTGLRRQVEAATLSLYSATAAPKAFTVSAVPDTAWQEATVSYASAPAFVPPTVGPGEQLLPGERALLDVTPLVSGGGPVSMAVRTTSAKLLSFASREEGVNPPHLVVETSNGAEPDGGPPSAPGSFAAEAEHERSVLLAWAPATDDRGAAGYVVRRDGVRIADVRDATRYVDTGVSPVSTYAYTVQAYDDAGNEGPETAPAVVTTPAPDTEAPTVPQDLAATATAHDRIALSWSASSDNRRVAGYRVRREGVVVATITTGTDHLDTGLRPVTRYVYTVEAFDARGNASGRSAPASATTPEEPDRPPTVPTALVASAVSPRDVTLSWTASTDDRGVAGYLVRRDGAQVADVTSGTSFRDGALTPRTTYGYTVEAYDSRGQRSGPSPASTVATPAEPVPAGAGAATPRPAEPASPRPPATSTTPARRAAIPSGAPAITSTASRLRFVLSSGLRFHLRNFPTGRTAYAVRLRRRLLARKTVTVVDPLKTTIRARFGAAARRALRRKRGRRVRVTITAGDARLTVTLRR